MKLENLNIDRRQIIILVIIAVMLVILSVYGIFFYLPKSRQIAEILNKVQDFDVNIKEEEVKVKAAGYEQEIGRMQQEIARLQGKFPSQNELPSLFQELFSQTDKFNIEIISIQPDKPSLYESNVDPKSDLIFNKIPIRSKLRADYRALAGFLRALFESPEYAFTFDDLSIEKKQDSDSNLSIELLLGAFVLSHKGALPLGDDLEKSLDINFIRGRR